MPDQPAAEPGRLLAGPEGRPPVAPPRVRAPRYLSRFQCVGAACPDSCCAGWQTIDVDAASYARYQEVSDPWIGPLLQRHVQRNPAPAGPEEHALIEVPAGGCCPFFGADGLCALQRTLGEALLPASCDTFPRQASLVDGWIDLAGRLACPEIARLALLEPDALEPVEVEPDRRLRERAPFWVEIPWPDQPPAGDPRRHYHQIRAQCVDVLRQPGVALETRLEALGLALGALAAWPNLDPAGIERVFATARARLSELQRQRDALQADGPRGPSPLLLQRLRPWLGMRELPPRYRTCLDRLQAGLGLPADPAAPLDERVARAYAAALPRLHAYQRRRPFALEHALLNQISTSSFPFHPTHSFLEEYAVLACRHALLKLHLVGAAAAEGELTDEVVVATVQAFDKYPDSPDYWRRTLDLLRREGALSLAGLAELLID